MHSTYLRCRDFVRRHPYWADGALAVVLYLITILWPISDHHPEEWSDMDPSLVLMIAGIPVFAPLAWRRRYPVAVLGASALGTLGFMIVGPVRGPILLGSALAVYTVSSVVERRLALGIGAITVLILGGTSMRLSVEAWDEPVNAIAFVWTALAIAVGEAVRNRRAFVAAIEERARRAEHTREEEARRRVAEERMRIARELHDIVGHHIALINVQAGVASHLLTSSPDQARQALAHVREAGRSALAELSATVTVLRQGDETDDDAPHEPTPGLDRLPELLDSFDRAGLRVSRRDEGQPRSLPATVDLTAYRVVQESLTNVRKHAGTSVARLHLAYRRDLLHIEVEDDGPGPGDPGPGTGHGLIGMRERAASVGGSFRAGRGPDGGFRVSVDLPLPRSAVGRRAGGAGAAAPFSNSSHGAT
ncbi:sensor histidine kinase [Streptacidiphilus carbonis]|uniref:sensor histidine kinase n=1 Tax=Streptacidiphilus carbonis TaxID=105422 RepID=UPI0005A7BCA1|nr:histidine kinase [Streptacidiphilus carbonis]